MTSEGVMDWRDMHTAPMDGTAILAVVDGRTRIVQWCKTSHLPWVGWNLADQGVEDFDLCTPTLWMPITEPPR